MLNNLKVARLAYRFYFKRAPLPTKISCAGRLLKNRFFRASAPISVMIAVTYRCQCRCVHCGMAAYAVDYSDELKAEEVKRLLGRIHKLGAIEVNFFGGEPLLIPRLEELIEYAGKLPLITTVDTNGMLLDRKTLGHLKKAGIAGLKISLDSAREEVHDKQRGVKGCFSRALGGIKECVSQGIPCLISTYATRENIRNGDLKQIINLGKRLGVTGVRILQTVLSGCFIASPGVCLSPAEKDELARLLEPGFVFLENMASSGNISEPVCSVVGKRYFYISPLGEVQPCCFVPLSFGNIREEPLETIVDRMWNSPLSNYPLKGCLMNNPDFRKRYLPFNSSPRKLPLKFESLS
ncbi:MAG: radical SAM protein [Candidatus Auribacterota bacterium]|nr:radical SAM protein [Candidatus Auribacterota bacterium]